MEKLEYGLMKSKLLVMVSDPIFFNRFVADFIQGVQGHFYFSIIC